MRLPILFCLVSPLLASVPCGTHLPKEPEHKRFKRIIGGNNVTSVSKWPWQVLVYSQDGDGEDKVCGGTIISENWILTAAHCVNTGANYHWKKFLVKGSATNFYLEKGRKMNVTRVIPYPQYHPRLPDHDIALLKLEKSLTFNYALSPICLPKSSQSIPSDGYAVTVGFGSFNYRGEKEIRDPDGQLREVILPIVERDVCNQRWVEEKSKEAVPNEKYIEHFKKLQIICAGAMGHGIYLGDSGGPLMMKAKDGKWFQVGVTAAVSDEIHAIYADVAPNAFTDVRPYCEWIKETTGGEASCQEEEVELEDVKIQE